LKITILGCGASAGSPFIGGADGAGDWGECDPKEMRNRRMRASVVIETGTGKRLLVDTGPDLREQLISNKINRIDAVFYTHGHADHIAGLDEVRILNRLLGAPMPAFTDARTAADLQRRFDYAFKPWTGPGFYRPVFALNLVEPGQNVDILRMPVRVIGQDHGHGPSLGLRIGGFAYCTDVVRLDDAALAALMDLDVLVVDCFTHTTPHPTHANLEQVLAWVARLQPRRTILTHMGPNMDYRWLVANLPAGLEPAFDGQTLTFDFP
jgi:phosphoribosyl 1,2-cyclic phosphate phosphodiesterase